MTALATLWALIPTKDKLYALLIAAILVAFGWYTHHERNIGAVGALGIQRKAATSQATVARVKTDTGVNTAHAAEIRYVTVLGSPAPLDSPRLLVLNSGAAASAVCAASYPTESDDPAESSVEHPRDVGPELDKIGRDADAQVTFLQSLIQSCVDIGACKLQQ